MILYHATDDVGAAGIAADGFAFSHVGDSQGCQWLSSDPAWTDSTNKTRTTMVLVELPDELAERYRYFFAPDDPHPCYYRVPFEVLNERRPFRFERL